MKPTFTDLLNTYVLRTAQPVSRIASQAELPRQTLFNWLAGRQPRFHANLPGDLERLSRALGLTNKEREALLLAAGCLCALETPPFQEKTTSSFRMPLDWHAAGSKPNQYDMGVDPDVQHGEHAAVVVASNTDEPEGFGTLMQNCPSGLFLGKRVRMSAIVRSDEIEGWGGLWFRVDGAQYGSSLAFDNMHDRPLTGTTDWSWQFIVLDVPQGATALAFGVMLAGAGKLWMADLQIEEVSLKIPTTCSRHPRTGPSNLDFTE